MPVTFPPATLDIVLVAAAPVAAHASLMVDGNGNAVPADPTAGAYLWLGLARVAAAAGAPVALARAGLLTDTAWSWAPGAPLYAAPAGALTQNIPQGGTYHKIGAAVTATTILLAPEPPITRS